MNQSELAKALGLNMSSISSYERGVRSPSKKVVIKLARLFGCSIEYLLAVSDERGGDGAALEQKGEVDGDLEALVARLKHMGVELKEIAGSITRPVPLVGNVGAGSATLAEENIESYLFSENSVDLAIQVHGESMEPLIMAGSIVLVKQIKESAFKNGDLGVVIVNQNEALVKRLYFFENGVWLVSENKRYPPVFYSPQEWERDCQLVGKVIETRYTF